MRGTGIANIPESALDAIAILMTPFAVRRVILFGSRAVGDHDQHSDVDIAISAPGLTHSELALLRDRVNNARTLYHIGVSALEEMPDALRIRVLAQGVTIYERQEATRWHRELGEGCLESGTGPVNSTRS